MPVMNIKLDVEDLERILLKDPEVGIQLTSSIVQAFAKRHLKAVLADDKFTEFLDREQKQVNKYLNAMVEQHVGKSNGLYGAKPDLNPRLVKELRATAGNLVDQAVEAAFATRLEAIDKIVEHKLAILTSQYIQRRVELRLAEIKDALAGGSDAA